MGTGNAALTTIGTATYNGSEYNLIWDDDNNGNSVVWLDYTNRHLLWAYQNDWAAALGSSLSYNIDPGYTVTWGNAAWRLPRIVNGPYTFGYDGTTTGGYNINSSEIGHLYYEELSNLGKIAIDGTYPQPGWGLNNTENFENLNGLAWYASGTVNSEISGMVWSYDLSSGLQKTNFIGNGRYAGLAIRSGQVSAAPVPAAVWLLGTGFVGLVGARRKFRK